MIGPNKSSDQLNNESQSMLITEIQQIGEQNNKKSALQGLSRKHYQVYVVEDQMPPTQFPPNQTYSPLPSTVEFQRIVANVITSLSTSTFKAIQSQHKDTNTQTIIEKWTGYLKLIENRALVSDCFWYAICKFFHKDQYISSEQELQKRIGKNYIGLFLSIDDKKQSKLFFKQYFNTLAQSVFYSFFYAFPKSRVKFDDKLKEELLTVFSKMFTGIEISNKRNYYEKWTLDLGTGNILAKKPKKNLNINQQPTDTLEYENKKFKIKQQPFLKTRKRQILPIRYSPIVDLYLKNNKYKTRNYVSEFKMKYSQNDKNKDQIETKFAHYRQQAARIFEWSQAQKEVQEVKKQQLQSEIKALKRETINHHRRLDRRKAEQLQRGAHEYANYLVSMLNAGITMTSLGVVRKNPV